ncbi:hypothetical protein GGR56DRAFT_665852 [Xylariaceae sp. FL0804]|nr:hypothetical protein GGR56DRAFT_665852 [Xylariaceae sp. FL0804]
MENKKGNISASLMHWRRHNAKLTCPIGDCGEELPNVDQRIRGHIKDQHQAVLESSTMDTLVQAIKKGRLVTSFFMDGPESDLASDVPPREGGPAGQPVSPADPGGGEGRPPETSDEAAASPNKRRKSPDFSNKTRARSTSPPRRSRARPGAPPEDPDFRRGLPQQGKKLWNPDATSSPSTQRARPSQKEQDPRNPDQDDDEAEANTLTKEPQTRPISQEQLVAEVKGIYAGLVMVEGKCIEVDNAQSSQNDTKLNNEQWQALIALHRTLLHEHHDFFLASQHPSASPALRRLAAKYSMPARMWRHGIHSFLELLRHRLPGSLEHMLTFIYLSYSMMALLYETVPAFEDTWIECLGDLGRYRMAIEDEDIRDREIWTSVSQHWYSKASDNAVTTGRLYHHLAILARPNALQQLFYYAKSLCVPIPFGSARESVLTLFDPILKANATQHSRLIPIDVAFVRAHGVLFCNKGSDDFHSACSEFLGLLDGHIGRTTRKWMESGYYIAIANCCSLLSYGKEDNFIMQAIKSKRQDQKSDPGLDSESASEQESVKEFAWATHLSVGTYEVVFHRLGDPNVFPFLHVTVVFMSHLTKFPSAMARVQSTFPWKLMSLMLNSLLLSCQSYERIQSDSFPREAQDVPPRPLPEDFAMKGLLWTLDYFPDDWFSNEKVDEDEKFFEVASMTDERKERILWGACRIARSGRWLTYEEEAHRFGVASDYEKEINDIAKNASSMDISEDPETITHDPMELDDRAAEKDIIRQ